MMGGMKDVTLGVDMDREVRFETTRSLEQRLALMMRRSMEFIFLLQ